MNKKYAFLFPGQGAQAPGMAQDIAQEFSVASDCIKKASAVLDMDIENLLWNTSKDVLSRSDNSQVAITVVSLCIMAVLKENGITPSAVMGFSLGEFPALYAGGVLDFDTVLKVVKERGKIMQAVCEKIATESNGKAPGMTAVIGLSPNVVLETISCLEGVYGANMNSIKQTVISGTFSGLEKAEEELKARGARRVVRLSVAGPFHCPLMQEAATKFGQYLESVPFNSPTIDIFSNVTGGKITSGEEAKKNAVLHLTNPVLWTQEEEILATTINADASSQWQVLETGPGKVLSGLWRDTAMGLKLSATVCNSADSIKAILT